VKSVGQIIDEIDSVVEYYTQHALNPDRAERLRQEALVIRKQLLSLRDFIVRDGTENKS
jgi:hypothetical protein